MVALPRMLRRQPRLRRFSNIGKRRDRALIWYHVERKPPAEDKESFMALRPRSALIASLSVLALLAFLAGCGSNPTTAPLSTGGATSATGFTQGVITGFGTIHLGRGANERVFHTKGAMLTRFDDGVTRLGRGDRDDNDMFHTGMKVKIYCDRDDSTRARNVIFMNDLEGPITAKPSANAGATFDVLGVPVLVDANTHFDDRFLRMGGTVDSLVMGNVLELSGDFDANDVLHATFVRFLRDTTRAGETFQIKGLILDLAGSTPTQTFTVHGASFTTDANTRIDLMGGLADSAFVQVKTQSTAAPFLATTVKGLNEGGYGDRGDHDGDFHHGGHHVESASVEGFVSDLTGTSPNLSFTLDTKPVVTNSATKGLALVVPNAHIEVRGTVDANGTIVAVKISRED
jgi:hypothetical protein